MTLVLLAGLSAGILQDAHGNVVPGRSVNVYARGTTTPVQVYSDSAGASPVTQPLTTDTSGQVPGYVAGGVSVDVVDALTGLRAQGEPLSANAVARTIATTYLTPSGGDDSAAMVAAVAAGGTIIMGPGTFLWNTSVPAFARNTPTRVVGAGAGETTIKLSPTAKRAFDMPYVADYDLYRDIEISDFTVDASALSAPASNQHLVLGNLINGGINQRVNFNNIACRRINVTGGPVATAAFAGVYEAFFLASAHPGTNEATQTTITNIVWEDLNVSGCNFGFAIIGSAPSNSANVLMDNIHWNRLTHDSGVLPSGSNTSVGGEQIGSAGYGGIWRVSNCKFTNLLDTFELDAAADCVCNNVVVTDARNEAFLAWRFNTVQPARTSHIFQNCTARIVNMQPAASNRSFGWQAGGSASLPLGEVRIRGCSRIGTSAVLGGAIAIQAASADIEELTIDDFTISHEALNDTTTAATTTFLNLFPLSARAVVTVHNVKIVLAGSLTNPSTLVMAGLTGTGGAGKDTLIDVDNIAIDNRLTGTGTFFGVFVGGSGGVASSTVHGRIAGVRALAGWTGAAPSSLAGVGSTTVNTVTNLVIENCDGIAAGGTLVNINSTQAASVIARDNAGFNPVGVVVVAVPATGVAVAAQPYDRSFYVTTAALGATLTIQNGPAIVIPASSFGTVRVPAGKTVTPTYTNAPTWLVEGE